MTPEPEPVDVRLVTCAHLPAPDPDTPIVADALRVSGLRVDVADWRDPTVRWDNAPVTVVRSPWDYVDTVTEFVGWADRVGAVSALWNPPAVLAWNVHKSYLLDLDTAGAPIVPTVVLLAGTAASLDGICDAQGWNEVVVKPAVGSGARGAGRFGVGDERGQGHLDALLAAGDVLAQPFLPAIATEGELSVVVIDGDVVHALRKRPAPGDYRVQEEWGGEVAIVDPGEAVSELAVRVVAAAPAPVLYARVDLVRYRGHWSVLELEVTEPSLWLDQAPPHSTDAFVRAVHARLAG